MEQDKFDTKRECKCAGKCGACQTLNLTYGAELSLKMKQEITLLGKFCHVDEIIPMEKPEAYRNKVDVYKRQAQSIPLTRIYLTENSPTFGLKPLSGNDKQLSSGAIRPTHENLSLIHI